MRLKISFCILFYSSINCPSIFKPKVGPSLVTKDTYRGTSRRLMVQRLSLLSETWTKVVLLGLLHFLKE